MWASADYQKTGVTPYVHESGTRVPSLRRAAAKWPHFTNGSADTLLDVVQRRTLRPKALLPRPSADAALPGRFSSFTPDQARELTAFLELL